MNSGLVFTSDISNLMARVGRLNPFEFRAGIYLMESEMIEQICIVLIPLNSGLVFTSGREPGPPTPAVLIPLNSGLVFTSTSAGANWARSLPS